jgi:hypothetical protein
LLSERLAGAKIDLQASVIGTDADWSIEGERVRPYCPLPNERVVSKDLHLCSVHFCAENMRVSGAQRGDRHAAAGLDVLVSTIAALRTGMLSRIAFY